MKLYHCQNSRSFRVLWALEEMGLEYDLAVMAFPPRAMEPDFLKVNPLGTVPAFTDGGLTMTESSGICHYLAEKYGPTELAVGPDDPAFGTYLNWLYRSDATLTFPQTLILRYSLFEPEARRQPQVVEDYTKWYLARLRSVETALEGQDYLCAGRFTMADIAVHFALFLGQALGLDTRYKPNCQRYLASMMERPGFQRAVARQGAKPSRWR